MSYISLFSLYLILVFIIERGFADGLFTVKKDVGLVAFPSDKIESAVVLSFFHCGFRCDAVSGCRWFTWNKQGLCEWGTALPRNIKPMIGGRAAIIKHEVRGMCVGVFVCVYVCVSVRVYSCLCACFCVSVCVCESACM